MLSIVAPFLRGLWLRCNFLNKYTVYATFHQYKERISLRHSHFCTQKKRILKIYIWRETENDMWEIQCIC